MAQFERPPYRPSNRRDDKRKGKRPGGRRVLERLEPLEDRVTPVVTAEAITDTLMVTMDGAGDHAFLSFDGTNVNVDDSAAGGSNKGSFAGITDIIVLDMGTEAGQRATFSGGTAFTQNVTAAGVETIDAFQQIGGTVAGDAAAVNVDDPGQIQDGIAFAAPGAAVNVAAGTFDEDVLLNKPGLRLLGAGPGVTTIRGVIGGDGATVRVGASGVEVAGFTITRLGNNPADWNDPNLNFAGIAVQGAATGMLVHDNLITGNRTGIDVNNSSGHTIRNNVIDFNHTGLIFRNQTDDLVVEENAITNNRTIGVLFLDASFGTNVPPQQALNSRFFNNNISGNWYAQVVDRQAGGNLPAPGTTNLKDFSGNWFGTSTPVITDADTTEPGYASLIPVEFGGTAVAPGGQPDVAGPASANFDITPLLETGADTDVETAPGRGTYGFQGDFSALRVTAELAQTGQTGRIREGVDLATAGGTVRVNAGTFAESVLVGKPVTLLGAGSGVLPADRTVPADESTIVADAGVTAVTVNASNVTVRGFTIVGSSGTQHGIAEVTPTTGTVVRENFISGFTSGLGIALAAGSSGALIRDNDISGNYAGIYLSVSASGNQILDNVVHDHLGTGLDAGSGLVFEGNNTNNLVHGNVFRDNQSAGIYVWTGFGDDFSGTVIECNEISGNATGLTTLSPGAIDAPRNWWGDPSGPTHPANPGGTGQAIVEATPGTVNFFPFATRLPVCGPAVLVFVQGPVVVIAGEVIAPAVTVEVRDEFGNLLDDDTTQVTLAFGNNPTGAVLGGTLTVTAVNGIATFADLTVQTAGTGYTLVASAAGGLTPALSGPFDVLAAAAAGIAFGQQPADVTAGEVIAPPVTVLVVDAFGNVVTADSSTAVTLALGANPGGGTLSGTLTVTAVSGVATFADLSIDQPGDGYTLTATSGALTATSDPFDVTPVPPPPVPPVPPVPPSPPVPPVPPTPPVPPVPPAPPSGQNTVSQFAVGSGAGGSGEVTVFDAALNPVATRTVFPPEEAPNGTRVAVADVNGDGTPDLVVGTGPGVVTGVKVIDGASGAELFSVTPFEATFTGGVFVAAGDVDGDGKADVVITPDEGGGPRVRIFRGGDFAQLNDFFGIEDPAFRGGARAALADVSGDGRTDLLVAAGFGGGPRVAAFDGVSVATGNTTPAKLFGDIFVFEDTLRNGVFITAGDLDGDGFADLIAGGGPGGGPRVFALSGADLVTDRTQTQVANFFAGDVNNRGGIRIVAKDIDGDGRADLVAGAGTGAPPVVTRYLGADIPPEGPAPELDSFLAGPADFVGGVFVG